MKENILKMRTALKIALNLPQTREILSFIFNKLVDGDVMFNPDKELRRISKRIEALEQLYDRTDNEVAKSIYMLISEICGIEALMWAISILTSAWTNWIFSSKSNDAQYRSDKPEVTINAQKILPYIEGVILNAMKAGREIGSNPLNKYRPENIRKIIQIKL